MTPPDQPKLPTWIFIVTDLALLAAAGTIATSAHRPFSEATTAWIAFCVITGAIVMAIPLVVRYEAQKNETLDDRQRALEGLARTITTAAEQISIAAGGLHEIAELAQKNLRHAEKLPHQLQDKIAEFQAQLVNANDVEKEELEKEVAALRTTESERLDSISDKVFKATAEWGKFEVTAQKRLTAAADTLAKTQAEASALEARLAATLATLEAQLAASTGLVERALASTTQNIVAAPVVIAPVADEAPPPPPAETAATESPKTESTAHPPKRPRKPRREEPVAEDAASPAPAPTEVAAVAGPESAPAEAAPPPASPVEEPPPVPGAAIPEVAPVAPHSAEPFAGNIAPAEPAPDSPAPEAPATGSAKPARKRAPKKPVAEDIDSALTLDITETPAAQSAEVHEQSRTSDGATRLIVTAYIGIGNRLFIRGEGPGLSWEKGVPLQFVSIGKWRWETSDASDPVKFKLYKNDDTECTALGTQSLDVGQQQEVTAAF
jgi:hypothetical protein